MRRRYLRYGIIGSLVLHTVLSGSLIVSKLTFMDDTEERSKRDEFVLVELPPLEDKPRNRIVETDQGDKVKEAPKDAFLGKENRVVKEETVGKVTGSGLAREVAKKKVPPKPKSNPRLPDINPKSGPLSKLGLAMLPKKVGGPKQEDRPEWVDFQKDHNEVHEDYVQGLDEAKHTALNTKEYVFFGYFQRIRKQLDQAWRPILRDHLVRITRRGRALAAEMDYTTKTLVTLDEGGEVVRVQVLSESGTRDLDSAAVKAFNRAGPFPNPPKDLVDASGEIKIRWDFILRT